MFINRQHRRPFFGHDDCVLGLCTEKRPKRFLRGTNSTPSFRLRALDKLVLILEYRLEGLASILCLMLHCLPGGSCVLNRVDASRIPRSL